MNFAGLDSRSEKVTNILRRCDVNKNFTMPC